MGLTVNAKKKVKGFSLDTAWEIGNEFAVLLGPSGSGKSLTLQIIAGLMKPDRGHIRLNDRTLFDDAAGINLTPQGRSFGYVFQDLALFPHLTIRENVLFGAHGLSKTEREQRASDMITRFRLTGLENKYPSEISGGQKQRVALARALIRKPEALLLDEPFSALDSPLRIEMQQFLKDLHRELPIPILFVTHDVIEAYSMADKIIVYDSGSVVRSGAPSTVFIKPANEGIALFVNSRWGLHQITETLR
jgi:molybdate transport system ATP-binding protein